MIEVTRNTKETNIKVALDIHNAGEIRVSTGVGFLDHMLESLCKHAHFSAIIECKGDVHIDFHHTAEDVGIVLGEALKKSIYPVQNIERFGDSVVVMDEAAISCAIDICNRSYLVYEIPVSGKVGEFDCELIEEFFRALCFNANITAHLIYLRGKNKHHIIEASFKAFAVALRRALSFNLKAATPSTKGVI